MRKMASPSLKSNRASVAVRKLPGQVQKNQEQVEALLDATSPLASLRRLALSRIE